MTEFVDHRLEVLGVLSRREGEDDIPDVEQPARLEVAGDVEQGGMLPEVGELVQCRLGDYTSAGAPGCR